MNLDEKENNESYHVNTPALSASNSTKDLPFANVKGAQIKASMNRGRRYENIAPKIVFATPQKTSSSYSSSSSSLSSSSALKIMGQRLVAESLSSIRNSKCCKYEQPEICSPTLPFEPQTPGKLSTMHRSRFATNNRPNLNIQPTSFYDDATISRGDMRLVKKQLTSLEKRRTKMIEAAKRPQGSQDPDDMEAAKIYLTLLPTRIL
ncbi:hypothetical protein TRFO_23008 [Tritrichomonas foetus]|uniref:Uncharacterized protein n=1 Tax=Tritrichomonas foetus TaxID=1144522 RepID=A0A1J4KB97_9EUKA|nr:hypothetical protein TRFO_23008 [Tritrichomonas foetus]|eukprot:OHT08491.1 hypothetical protein TRFO_23008 [Tritrichomonas foetus]